MATTDIGTIAPANEEAVEAWDGPLFDVWVRLRHILVTGLKAHGDEALRLYPVGEGEVVLDIGCGLGDTTQDIARAVGAGGRCIGVDASARFIDQAKVEAEEAGVDNAEFLVCDVETATYDVTFDRAYSRMGTMFFANPVAALRNVRTALRPGGLLTMVVWRAKDQNDWLYQAQLITERFLTKPEDYDEPTCGPGPFSMANADTVTGILKSAGYGDITLHRCDKDILIGRDMDEAIDLVMSIGPAGEIIRLNGERGADRHEAIREALREGLAKWTREDGTVHGPASTWIAVGRNPA